MWYNQPNTKNKSDKIKLTFISCALIFFRLWFDIFCLYNKQQQKVETKIFIYILKFILFDQHLIAILDIFCLYYMHLQKIDVFYFSKVI